jgi:hypothetical protein
MSFTSFGIGFTAGYGSGLLSRELLPIVREISSPIFRVTVRLTVKAIESVRESVSRLGETLEDIYAEVTHELKRGRKKKGVEMRVGLKQVKRKKKGVRSKPAELTSVERAA